MNPPTSLRAGRLAALTLVAVAASACASHQHSIGLGATGTGVQTARQYYVLFGLAKVNEVDPQRMAEGLTSYTIETRFGFVDLLLMPFLLPLSATSRTVVVRT
ncbi:MAG: hypothetical protein JNL08_17370 [Planctomycetes bacterium]|nr:hypothetical protein [Planctomycetota bacterium]